MDDEIDYKEIAKELLNDAKRGDSEAQSLLGQMYYEGIGVEKNYKKAALWLKKAAKQGDTDARAILEKMPKPKPKFSISARTSAELHEVKELLKAVVSSKITGIVLACSLFLMFVSWVNRVPDVQETKYSRYPLWKISYLQTHLPKEPQKICVIGKVIGVSFENDWRYRYKVIIKDSSECIMSFLVDNPNKDNNLLNTQPIYEDDEVLVEGMTTNSIYELSDYKVSIIKTGYKHDEDVRIKRDVYNLLNELRNF